MSKHFVQVHSKVLQMERKTLVLLLGVLLVLIRLARPLPVPCDTSDVSSTTPLSKGNSSPLTSPSNREMRDLDTTESESTSTVTHASPLLTFKPIMESASSVSQPTSTEKTTTIATANPLLLKYHNKYRRETDQRENAKNFNDSDRSKRDDGDDDDDDDRRKRSDETDESDDDRRKRSDESDDDRRKRSDETDESDDDRRKRRDDSDDNSDDSDDSNSKKKRDDDDSDNDDDDDDDDSDSNTHRRNNNRDSDSSRRNEMNNPDKSNRNDNRNDNRDSETSRRNENSDSDTHRRDKRQTNDEDSTDSDIDDGDDVDGFDGDDDDSDGYDSYYRKKRGTYYIDGELHNDGSFVKSLTFRKRRDTDESGEIETYLGYPQFRKRRDPAAETNPTIVPWKDDGTGPDHSEDDGDSEEAPDDIPYRKRRQAPPSTDLEPPKAENDESYSMLRDPVTVRKQSVSLESVPDPARPVTGPIPAILPNHQETYNNLKKTLQAFEELALLTFFGVHIQQDQPYGNSNNSDGTTSSDGNVPVIPSVNSETSTSVSSVNNMPAYTTVAAKEESTMGSINDLGTKTLAGEQESTTHINETTDDDYSQPKTTGRSDRTAEINAETSSVPGADYISTTESEFYTTVSEQATEDKRLKYAMEYPLDLFID